MYIVHGSSSAETINFKGYIKRYFYLKFAHLITKDTPSAYAYTINFPDFDKNIIFLLGYSCLIQMQRYMFIQKHFLYDSFPTLSTLYRQGARHCRPLYRP